MISFTQYKWILIIGSVLAVLGGATYGWHEVTVGYENRGYEKAKHEFAIRELRIQEINRKRENDLNAQLSKARNDATKRNQHIEELSRSLDATSQRLRDTIASNRKQINSATREAVSRYAETAGELLGKCAEEYRAMAENADRERSDSLMYQDAWPD